MWISIKQKILLFGIAAFLLGSAAGFTMLLKLNVAISDRMIFTGITIWGIFAVLIATGGHYWGTQLTSVLQALEDSAVLLGENKFPHKPLILERNDEFGRLWWHLQQTNQLLQQKSTELETLKIAGDVLGSIQLEKEVLKNTLKILYTRTRMNWSSAYMMDSGNTLECRIHFVMQDESSAVFHDTLTGPAQPRTFKQGQGIAGFAAQTQTMILVPNTFDDPRYIMSPDDVPRTLLCIPLADKQQTLGVINLSCPVGTIVLKEDDLDFIRNIARMTLSIVKNIRMFQQIQGALRTTRLYNEELKQEMELQKFVEQTYQTTIEDVHRLQKQMLEELEQARETQLFLMPQTLPVHPAIQFSSTYLPMSQVGGDFYNVLDLDNGCFGIVVGDVTGHGISAALISFMVSVVFQESAMTGASPSQVMRLTNERLYQKLENGKFATIFYAVYDTHSHVLSYCGAGHPPAVILHQNTDAIHPVTTIGTMVGVFSSNDVIYHERQLTLEPGDKVLFYTDGILEIANNEGKLWGKNAFYDFLSQRHTFALNRILPEMIEFAHQYTGFDPTRVIGFDGAGFSDFNDDLTFVGFEVLS
ncbi:MAG: SpoIIE family protein phosphatase [SAR324 cluster bacterium]|nr:SpoIIE family protein phosphatase [SAR324 cluster bacterium]